MCKQENIAITAYAPLGAPGLRDTPDHGRVGVVPLLQHPVVAAIAEKRSKTPAQVLVRWSIDGGIIVIPKSVKSERIKENFAVFDFALTESEMAALNALERQERYFLQAWTGLALYE